MFSALAVSGQTTSVNKSLLSRSVSNDGDAFIVPARDDAGVKLEADYPMHQGIGQHVNRDPPAR